MYAKSTKARFVWLVLLVALGVSVMLNLYLSRRSGVEEMQMEVPVAQILPVTIAPLRVNTLAEMDSGEQAIVSTNNHPLLLFAGNGKALVANVTNVWDISPDCRYLVAEGVQDLERFAVLVDLGVPQNAIAHYRLRGPHQLTIPIEFAFNDRYLAISYWNYAQPAENWDTIRVYQIGDWEEVADIQVMNYSEFAWAADNDSLLIKREVDSQFVYEAVHVTSQYSAEIPAEEFQNRRLDRSAMELSSDITRSRLCTKTS